MNSSPALTLRSARRRDFPDAPRQPRVLLLTSGLGQGHTRVANAIAAGLIQRSAEAETLDLWSLVNPNAVSVIHRTYLELVQNHPHLYERLYHLDERTWRQILESESGPPAEVLEVLELIASIAADTESPAAQSLRYSSDRFLLTLLYTSLPYDGASLAGNGVKARLALFKWTWMRLVKRLGQAIDAYAPDIIVCTQMIPAAMTSWLKQRRGLRQPIVGVVTDYGVHEFWVQPHIDRYCVAHSGLRDAFANEHREHDAHATGVPLMPAFAHPVSQANARRQLDLPTDTPLALVLGGGLGLSVDSVAQQLLSVPSELRLLVMAGTNASLDDRLNALARTHGARVRVCGWTDRMDVYLRAADLVVGKPGGVSVAEALACGRPLFATRSLGGQEGFNVKFLETHRVGALVSDDELSECVRTVVDRPETLAAIQARASSLGARTGAAQVAEIVLDLCWSDRAHARATEH